MRSTTTPDRWLGQRTLRAILAAIAAPGYPAAGRRQMPRDSGDCIDSGGAFDEHPRVERVWRVAVLESARSRAGRGPRRAGRHVT